MRAQRVCQTRHACRFGVESRPNRPLVCRIGPAPALHVHPSARQRRNHGPQRCAADQPARPSHMSILLPRSRRDTPANRRVCNDNPPHAPLPAVKLRSNVRGYRTTGPASPATVALVRSLRWFSTVAIEADPNDRRPMPRTLQSAARFRAWRGRWAPL